MTCHPARRRRGNLHPRRPRCLRQTRHRRRRRPLCPSPPFPSHPRRVGAPSLTPDAPKVALSPSLSWRAPMRAVDKAYRLPDLSSFVLSPAARAAKMAVRRSTAAGRANRVPPRRGTPTPAAPKYTLPFETIEHGHERWTVSGPVKNCQHCQSKFTLLLRKHHCRACGACVCQSCSPYKTADSGLRYAAVAVRPRVLFKRRGRAVWPQVVPLLQRPRTGRCVRRRAGCVAPA